MSCYSSLISSFDPLLVNYCFVLIRNTAYICLSLIQAFFVVFFRPPKPKRLPMDKHLKRQIANCNERKRMQSINTGFVALRAQMPHIQGEKLSKVGSPYKSDIGYTE